MSFRLSVVEISVKGANALADRMRAPDQVTRDAVQTSVRPLYFPWARDVRGSTIDRVKQQQK